MAKQLEEGLDQAKKMSDSLPPDLRSILEDISLHRDGGSVKIVAKLSDSQLKALSKLGGGFGGGLGGGID